MDGSLQPRARSEPDRRPYSIGPHDGPVAVLLHGLTGSPWDLKPLAEGLANAGWRVHAPRQAGHTDSESLAQTSWQGWYETAEGVVESARRPGQRTLVVGFSMGSLVALRLAALRPEWLAGLVVLGVPIQQPRWHIVFAELLVRLRRASPLLAARIGHHHKERSDARSEAMALRLKNLEDMPYESILELGRLQDEVRPLLPRIRTPTLVMHGAFDHSAPVEGSARVSQALGASEVRRVVLTRSYHHVIRDIEGELACAEILRFAERARARAGRPEVEVAR